MLPPMLHAAQKLTLFDCQIYIVGNAIMSATGTATFKKSAGGGNFFWVGKIPGPPPLYEALVCMYVCVPVVEPCSVSPVLDGVYPERELIFQCLCKVLSEQLLVRIHHAEGVVHGCQEGVQVQPGFKPDHEVFDNEGKVPQDFCPHHRLPYGLEDLVVGGPPNAPPLVLCRPGLCTWEDVLGMGGAHVKP